MKIFVSYARVDKAFCIRIIETLHAHDVWYDQRLNTGQDWWKEILRRLDWCDLFVYLLSPDSVASRYCRRELEVALQLRREIVPVLIDRSTVLPAKIKDWQFVDLSDSLTVENVSLLLNAILIAERRRSAAAANGGEPAPASSDNPVDLVSEGVKALEKGDYDKAIVLLKQAQASGYRSRFVPLDKLLRVAESAVAGRSNSRELEREYQHIVALFAFESTRQMACEALAEFQKEFGNYDPQNLRRFCKSGDSATMGISDTVKASGILTAPRPQTPVKTARQALVKAEALTATSQALADAPQNQAFLRARSAALAFDEPSAVKEILPMLQWCDIAHGSVTISSLVGADEDFGEITEQVDNFVMSKYPVTNAQFDIFVQAQDGYKNPRWWSHSAHAQRWFKLGKGAAGSRFSGDSLPRENVNWYEAMAFANWLGDMLKMKIALPTIAQWQRAAKGDDDRYFPWGDEYHEEHCNTLETGLKTTTPVDRYHKGISPYGVFDLAGNIWEWTLNTAAAAEDGRDYRRAVAGGSFVSPCDRAQTSFRYYLDPRVRYSSIGFRLVGLT